MALKQAALQWWRELEAFMKTMGFFTEHPPMLEYLFTNILTGGLVIAPVLCR